MENRDHLADDAAATEKPASSAAAPATPAGTSDRNDASELKNYDPIPDHRLYVPDNEDWKAEIKRDSEKVYCYSKHPGQDWFHLILNGEIYVSRQHERYCLRCALRMGFLTDDRLFWQNRVSRRSKRSL
ncbi:hypothetical protein [Schlesneria sp. T3-172]|uniref:hypothetical protein n=1 Tax=Schlesneria sphaerica TaxID=3373610 RepID=UPI0037C57851